MATYPYFETARIFAPTGITDKGTAKAQKSNMMHR
jgi:hypothetical protein